MRIACSQCPREGKLINLAIFFALDALNFIYKNLGEQIPAQLIFGERHNNEFAWQLSSTLRTSKIGVSLHIALLASIEFCINYCRQWIERHWEIKFGLSWYFRWIETSGSIFQWWTNINFQSFVMWLMTRTAEEKVIFTCYRNDICHLASHWCASSACGSNRCCGIVFLGRKENIPICCVRFKVSQIIHKEY